MTVGTLVKQQAEGQWPPPQGRWTYADYKRLPQDGWRYEVIEGELHMAPAPRPKHQKVGMHLSSSMHQHAKHRGLGAVLTAPIDVILAGYASPVQPDILFIRKDRLHIIQDEYVEGPPDLVVEILSPSNWLDDRRTKFRLYAQAGVLEYWLVDPEARSVEVFRLEGARYTQLGKYGPGESVQSEVMDGFAIAVEEICPN